MEIKEKSLKIVQAAQIGFHQWWMADETLISFLKVLHSKTILNMQLKNKNLIRLGSCCEIFEHLKNIENSFCDCLVA